MRVPHKICLLVEEHLVLNIESYLILCAHSMNSHEPARVVSGGVCDELVLRASGSRKVCLENAECDVGRNCRDVLRLSTRRAGSNSKPTGPQLPIRNSYTIVQLIVQ